MVESKSNSSRPLVEYVIVVFRLSAAQGLYGYQGWADVWYFDAFRFHSEKTINRFPFYINFDFSKLR